MWFYKMWFLQKSWNKSWARPEGLFLDFTTKATVFIATMLKSLSLVPRYYWFQTPLVIAPTTPTTYGIPAGVVGASPTTSYSLPSAVAANSPANSFNVPAPVMLLPQMSLSGLTSGSTMSIIVPSGLNSLARSSTGQSILQPNILQVGARRV